MADDLSSDEDEVRESAQCSLIKEIYAKWGEVKLFVKKYYPDTILANRAVHIFNDNAMMQFRKILPCRQTQLTLEKFLVKEDMKTTSEEEESTVSKRQRREKRQKESYPAFTERDSPS